MTLGLIGIGVMGGQMLRRLRGAGLQMVVADRDADRLSWAQDLGATVGTAAECDLVMLSLPSSAITVAVLEQEILPVARPGQVVADFGTTEARETRRLAALFGEKGAALLDCPVSGAPSSGQMLMFAGGERDAFDRALPTFEVLAGRVTYCGPSGSGQAVKGVNQLAMGLVAAAQMEAVAYGIRCGVDPHVIGDAVGGEGWRSAIERISREGAEAMTVKQPELPYFLGEASELDFPLPLTEALYRFVSTGPNNRRDNMNRMESSFWIMLTQGFEPIMP